MPGTGKTQRVVLGAGKWYIAPYTSGALDMETVGEEDNLLGYTQGGATITFTGDFQRMVYLAIHGELFQGVVNVTENEDGSVVKEVVTQGYGGEVETHVTLDAEGRVTAISVRDAQETDGIGAVLTADGSEYIAALIAGQDDLDAVDAVTDATVTSDALKQAVEFALADE